MDCVPKKSRAAWNSFESITRFTWSGSAVLGGYLVEQYSFKFCFLVTAVIYTMSTGVFYVLLAADIPIEKKLTHDSSDNSNKNNQQIHTNLIDDYGFHEHRSMNTKPTTSYRTLN